MSKNMLGVALREFRGPLNTLVERLAGEDGDIWLAELNKYLRGEPCMVNGIPYPKLLWSSCKGEIRNIEHLYTLIDDYRTANGLGWRLPTVNEFSRYLKSLKKGEPNWPDSGDYFVAVLIDNTIFSWIYFHDGEGNLFRLKPHKSATKPHVILCREDDKKSSN